MARKDSDPPERPDIEIGASVKADSLRFQAKPRTEVELHGEILESGDRGDIDMTSGSQRENLPDEVEPEVTYRDVRVRWRATARIEDHERPDTPKRREQ